ncbi:MAG: TetR/AcrR family transcriptional regulator [Variovorax sp.]|nr:MAG: TetR/AcrR family transcriptional regulator [Variovorax sp.]
MTRRARHNRDVMSKSSTSTPASRSDAALTSTKERLLLEAMRLFARNGMNAVSLRRIVAAAGAGNLSALHYHFGNRESVVREVAQMLKRILEPRCLERLAALDSRAHGVRDALDAAFGPMIDMLGEPGLGRDAVCFIGRLGWDFGEEGQHISADLHRELMEQTHARLVVLLPGLEPEILKFRLLLTMNSLYYGISYRSYAMRSPFGALSIGRRGNEVQERALFMDYLESGITHPL